MQRFLAAQCVSVCLLLCAAIGAGAQMPTSPLNLSDENHTVHILPTPANAQNLIKPDVGPLIYHNGKVMLSQTTYAIFWLPAKLQDGTATSMSAKYQPVIKSFLADYPSHEITANSTQYSQQVGKTITYIKGNGSYGGFYVDTDPYPASGCTDPDTPHGCITDAQIQAEITKVMGVKGWTGSAATASPTKMFLVFTSSGEGSCFDNVSGVCAYNYYCAYHGSYTNASGAVVVYGNEPYADPTYCFYNGIQQSPNGDKYADGAVNVASHEMTEAATDPNPNTGWADAAGNEIGDLCAWTFGTLGWDVGLANHMWNGHYYDLQLEYDNHVAGCVQGGP